jgi:hypothetical protein
VYGITAALDRSSTFPAFLGSFPIVVISKLPLNPFHDLPPRLWPGALPLTPVLCFSPYSILGPSYGHLSNIGAAKQVLLKYERLTMLYRSGRLRVKESSGVNFVETSVLTGKKLILERDENEKRFCHFALLCLLTSIASPVTATVDNSDTPSMQDAAAGSDNEAIAKFYEDEARKRHEIVARYYEDEARKAQDLQAHTAALARKYEKAAKADAKEAATHRQIALKLKEKNLAAASSVQKFSVVNESRGRFQRDN